MKAFAENYQQKKTTGEDYQTVILDDSLTAETDSAALRKDDPLDDETKSDEEIAENLDDDTDEHLTTDQDPENDDYIEDDDAYFDDEY